MSLEEVCDQLGLLRDNEHNPIALSHKSNQLLVLFMNGEQKPLEDFLREERNNAVHEQTAITCVCSLKKSIEEEGSQENILVGTENCKLHIVDPSQNYKVIHTIDLPSVPIQLSARGAINVEYKVK